MTALIRNCAFSWFYPVFKPRLWILYEVTEYTLTCDQEFPHGRDITPYMLHIGEMIFTGVQPTLLRYGYCCSNPRDQTYLIAWLELLILLRRLNLPTLDVREIMDMLTWQNTAGKLHHMLSGVSIDKDKGIMVVNECTYDFKPFQR
jgi:hypothetical protein